jgi:predicted DNA-binding protein with PD1-like motif
MFSTELVGGRRIAVVLQPGDDILGALGEACAAHGIEQGYLPVFLGAFTEVSLIGTCLPVEDEDVPLKDSVLLTNVEGTGSGTIAWDAAATSVQIHLHVAIGMKSRAAAGYAGHLLGGTVHYVTEVVVEEVLAPRFARRPDPAAHDIPNLVLEAV